MVIKYPMKKKCIKTIQRDSYKNQNLGIWAMGGH